MLFVVDMLFRWILIIMSAFVCILGSTFAVDNSQSLFNADGNLWYDGEAEDVNLIWTDNQQQDAFVNIVKSWVNWVLGILALIALIIVMYGGFLMVTSAGNDDAYGKWFTILKYAAIWLMLIGVAWFIVSIIFWLVSITANEAKGTSADTNL